MNRDTFELSEAEFREFVSKIPEMTRMEIYAIIDQRWKDLNSNVSLLDRIPYLKTINQVIWDTNLDYKKADAKIPEYKFVDNIRYQIVEIFLTQF